MNGGYRAQRSVGRDARRKAWGLTGREAYCRRRRKEGARPVRIAHLAVRGCNEA